MGRILAWIASVLAGAGLGLVSAWAAISFGQSSFSEHYGAWAFNRAAGSVAADPYTRAIVARYGLLALSARETVYFTLSTDERGQPLDESCVYELAGRAFDARWWSVTLYANDSYLARNDDHAGSVDATRVHLGADGVWRARIAPVQGDAIYWLSSRSARRGFSVTLRVYNPGPDFAPSAEALPVLRTISCPGGAA